MKSAVFIGGVGGSFSVPADWSNPTNWADGVVPETSQCLDIVNQSNDQSAADISIVAHDLVDANLGLSVLKFLSVHDLSGSGITVVGKLDVRHDASLGTLELRAGGTAEIERDFIGAASFASGTPDRAPATNSTLILDHPHSDVLANAILFASPLSVGTPPDQILPFGNYPTGRIELGRVAFDQADFVPDLPGGDHGKIQLTDHSTPIYQLADVTLAGYGSSGAPTLSVGRDATTGYDFVSYQL